MDYDIISDKKAYCAKHYVESEDEECLFWDLYLMMEESQSRTLEEKSKRILAEIKRSYPNLIAKYEESKK
jgi:hypothetical protein